MMTEDKFLNLAKCLNDLQPIFDHFIEFSGFHEQKKGIGRYPRKRLVKYGDVNYYIDLQMDLDESKKYFEEFFPKIPFSMGAGAWIDDNMTRFSTNLWCFERIPFNELQKRIKQDLHNALIQLKKISKEQLQKDGLKSKIHDKY